MTINPYQAPTHEPVGPAVDPDSPYESQASRVTILTALLAVAAGLSAASMVSTSLEMELLRQASRGIVDDAAIEAHETRAAAIAIATLVVYLSTVVVFGMFLYRANKNARALRGPHDALLFTPGWTVGWFFVPIANLWKPYQAVRELWSISRPALPSLLGVWWTVWIVDNGLAQYATRSYQSAQEIPEILGADRIMLASDTMSIVSAIVALLLVRSIHASQRRHHETGQVQLD